MAKKTNYFWASYSDLMTSLFFIMLVLFILTVVVLKKQYRESEEKRKVTENQLKVLKEIQNSTEELPDEYFDYDKAYKRFELKRQIKFEHNSSVIPQDDYNYLMSVGTSISNLIDSLKTKEKYKNMDIKYLIVIEGMASKIGGTDMTNYELSYQRALSLYLFWKNNNIIFDENVCEIQIAGSGVYGIGRDENSEVNNQRFLIQIIPKTGKIELDYTDTKI